MFRAFPWKQLNPPPPRWELMLLLTGDSARCSHQALTIRLGLLGLTSIFPHHLSQLLIRRWLVDSSVPLFTRVFKTCGRKSGDTTTKLIIKLWSMAVWDYSCQDLSHRPKAEGGSPLICQGKFQYTSRVATRIAICAQRFLLLATPKWKR